MKYLVVNGDDLGYSKPRNCGIVRCYREGIVTSTSILINGEAVQHAVDLVKTYGIPTGKIEDIVTSTSVLINGEAVQHAVDLVKTYGISTGKMDLNKGVFTGNGGLGGLSIFYL